MHEKAKTYNGNNWKILGIERVYNYTIFDYKQLDDLIWSLKNNDILEYRKDNRLIKFKVVEKYRQLEDVEDDDLMENYISDRRNEIINEIHREGYKIIGFDCSTLESNIIESLLESNRYQLEIQDNRILLRQI